MPSDLHTLSALDLLAAYRKGELSPVDVTAAAFDRIEAIEPRINAFFLLDRESALRAARESEERWRKGTPLGLADGVPTPVKDLMLTKGWPTLRGSKTVSPDQAWTEDSPPVARLREHGAVLVGKTTTSEFAWKGVTDSPLTGITRNPWNPERTPGGSSGGSAAAVAAGMSPWAVGTDAGGSVRIPASFCGIFTHKPSTGRVPAYPFTPWGTFASAGPMTWTVADAALMLGILAEPDHRDWNALPYEAVRYHERLDRDLEGLRVAWSPTLGYAKVSPDVAEATARAAHVFAEMGCHVEEVETVFPEPADIFIRLKTALARVAFRHIGEDKHALMDPGLVELIRSSRSAEVESYLDADIARARLGMAMKAFHQDYDLLLTPSVAVTAFEVGRNAPDGYARQVDWSPFSYPFNLTRQPAASVPCGFDREGLPIGLQIVGANHQDLLVLQAARAFEKARPWHHNRPRA